MSYFETIFFWLATFVYGISSALYIYALVFKNEKVFEKIHYFVIIGFILHTLAIAARYSAIGNLPVAGDYENSLAGSWIVVLITLYIILRYKPLRILGVATLPFSLLMLGYGVMRAGELAPMTVSLKSFWLYVHVFFAWLAFGAFAIAFGFGIIYILKEKNSANDFYNKFPALSRIDDLMFKYVIFGFITDTVMITSGAIWAKDLWGSYWGCDPVETWSLITWIIYGIVIHLRVTLGWRGRRLAWIVIGALAGMIITYFGINLFVESSLHIFEAWKEM